MGATDSLTPTTGQLVGVVERASATPGVVRYELNRSLTGMGHERFHSLVDADGSTPASSVARQLLATGKVASVHVYANQITVDLAKGHDSSGLDGIIREMYRYWKPGVEPPTFDDLPADEPAAVSAGGDDSGPELSEAAKRVPAHLLERSRAARAVRGGSAAPEPQSSRPEGRLL